MSNIIQFPKVQKSMYPNASGVGAGSVKSALKTLIKSKTLKKLSTGVKDLAPLRYKGKTYPTKKKFGHSADYSFMKDYKKSEAKYSKDVDYYLSGKQLRSAKMADERLQNFREVNKSRVDLIKQNRRDVGDYNRLVHKMNKGEAAQARSNLIKDSSAALITGSAIGAIGYGIKKYKDAPYRPTKKKKPVFTPPLRYQEVK